MAKQTDGRRGGGDLTQQIDRLKKAVGREGVTQAKEIVDSYEPDVIRLAFKQVPKGPANGLGSRVENLIANMPKGKQDEARALLENAKAVSAS